MNDSFLVSSAGYGALRFDGAVKNRKGVLKQRVRAIGAYAQTRFAVVTPDADGRDKIGKIHHLGPRWQFLQGQPDGNYACFSRSIIEKRGSCRMLRFNAVWRRR